MKSTKPFGFRLFALLAVLAMIAAACTTDADEEPTTGTVAPVDVDEPAPDPVDDDADDDVTAPVVSGVPFRIGFISNITTDNWWASMDTLVTTYNFAFLGNAKTSMFRLTNPGFVYVPGIAATAEAVSAVEEGDVWTVTQPIREDMFWSDGVPVTANDLAFYFSTVREFSLGGNSAANFLPPVLNVEAPDDFTVKITFESEPGLATWQNGVGFAPFVPSHFWQEHVDAARAAAEAVTAGITDAEITEAEHGRDALEQLNAAPVDLVLTDLNMPEMDGETLIRHVKASPKLTGIPIIVISSAAHEGNVEKLKSHAAAAVINKPMSPTAISDAMAGLNLE